MPDVSQLGEVELRWVSGVGDSFYLFTWLLLFGHHVVSHSLQHHGL